MKDVKLKIEKDNSENVIERIETPSETIIKKSRKEYSIIDDLGRKIVISKPSWEKSTQFLKALGTNVNHADGSFNHPYYESVVALSFVKSVDGMPVSIRNELDFSRWINELDNEGRDAVNKCVMENLMIYQTESEGKEEIKK